MSDKESPIMVHDSDSESDSDSQTSGRDPEPMEGLDNVVQGQAVSNCPVLGTESTNNERESEGLVTIPQKDRHEVITVDSSDDENEGQVPVILPSSLQLQGLEGVGRMLEEHNAQSHMVPQTGSVLLEGEQETSCSHPEPAEYLKSIKQGPVSSNLGIQEWDMDCEVSSKGFATPEDNQHASGDDVKSAEEINTTDISQRKRIRGLSLGPSQGPTASSLRINVIQGTMSNPPNKQESDQHASGSSVRPEEPNLAPSVHSHERATPLTTSFETRLLAISLQPQGLWGAEKLLQEMNAHKQIPTHVEDQTNGTVPEAEQCASGTRMKHGQSNYTEGPIPDVCIEARLLSQSLKPKGLKRVGRLLEDDMKMPTQIPPQVECIENQTHSAVQVSQMKMTSKEITQKDQPDTNTIFINVDSESSEDEDERLLPLVLLSPNLQLLGLEGEGKLSEKQNPQSQKIVTERELECTENQMGSVTVEGGQEASMSDQEPAEDLSNVTQGPRSNTPGIQECGMDSTDDKEVVVTPEDKRHASGNDVRPAEGTRRKRSLSPDPLQGSTTSSPSKRKSKTGEQFRRMDYESYTEQYLYAIVLPFQCPYDRKVVKVGVSGDPKQRFGKIRCGFKVLRDQSTELKLTDGICLNTSKLAEKTIDEIFISRIQMQVIERQKAESDIRNLIMAKSLSNEFFDSLEEEIKNTSDTPEAAVEKVKKINHNCAPTEWIMCDTQTVEALRCAYDSGELHGTVRSLTDDKRIWGSYDQFVKKLQKVIRNSQ